MVCSPEHRGAIGWHAWVDVRRLVEVLKLSVLTQQRRPFRRLDRRIRYAHAHSHRFTSFALETSVERNPLMNAPPYTKCEAKIPAQTIGISLFSLAMREATRTRPAYAKSGKVTIRTSANPANQNRGMLVTYRSIIEGTAYRTRREFAGKCRKKKPRWRPKFHT